MLDDVMFDAGIALSLEVLSSRISSPIYQYIFSYEAPFGMIKSLVQVENGELRVMSLSRKFIFARYCDVLVLSARRNAILHFNKLHLFTIFTSTRRCSWWRFDIWILLGRVEKCAATRFPRGENGAHLYHAVGQFCQGWVRRNNYWLLN